MRGDYHDPDCQYSATEPCTCGLIASVIGPTPTPARSEAAGGEEPIADVLEMLENVVDFAYEHGYHEHGVPLVGLVRERLASLGQQLAAAREAGARLAFAALMADKVREHSRKIEVGAVCDGFLLNESEWVALQLAARSEPSGEADRD